MRNGAWLLAATALAAAAQAQVAGCPEYPFAPGAAVEAYLDANDCRLTQVAGSGGSAFAKRYRLELTEASIVTIDAVSEDFDAQLLVLTASPTSIVGYSDDISADSTDSRVQIHLPAGRHFIAVSSFGFPSAGRFLLSATVEKPRECRPVPLPASGVTRGEFHADRSCRFVDLETYSSDPGYLQYYDLTMPRSGILSVEAASEAEEFALLAAQGPQFTTSGSTSLLASMPAGPVLMLAASLTEGPYSLTVTVANPRACTPGTLTAGTEVSGTLDATGCRVLDHVVPSDDLRPLRLYRVTVDRPSVMTFDEVSTAIDAYFFLYDSNTRLIGSNDDFNRSTNSRLTIHLPAGSYLAGASAYYDDDRGPFTLRSSSEALRSCAVQDLVSQQAREGTMPTDGCRYIDMVPLSQVLAPVVPFRLSSPGRRTVTLDARQGPVGATMSLLTPQLAETVRWTLSTTARTTTDVTVLGGDHTILLWNAAVPVAASYGLTAVVNEARTCTATDIGPNDKVRGTLTGAPCRLTEALPYYPVSAPVQSYRLRLPTAGRLTAELNPLGFVPVLVATQGDSIVAQAQGFIVDAVGLTGTIQAGELRFHASTRTGAGSFEFTTAFVPAGASSTSAPDVPLAAREPVDLSGPRDLQSVAERAARRTRNRYSASTPLFQ